VVEVRSTVPKCQHIQGPLRYTHRHCADCVTAVFHPDTPSQSAGPACGRLRRRLNCNTKWGCNFFNLGQISTQKMLERELRPFICTLLNFLKPIAIFPRRRSEYKVRRENRIKRSKTIGWWRINFHWNVRYDDDINEIKKSRKNSASAVTIGCARLYDADDATLIILNYQWYRTSLSTRLK